MSLGRTTFRRAGFALTAIAGLALASPAHAQPPLKSSPVKGTPTQTVSPAQCAAFGSYVLDLSEKDGVNFTDTFLNGVSRFVAAKCATHDAKGEIQLITMSR